MWAFLAPREGKLASGVELGRHPPAPQDRHCGGSAPPLPGFFLPRHCRSGTVLRPRSDEICTAGLALAALEGSPLRSCRRLLADLKRESRLGGSHLLQPIRDTVWRAAASLPRPPSQRARFARHVKSQNEAQPRHLGTRPSARETRAGLGRGRDRAQTPVLAVGAFLARAPAGRLVGGRPSTLHGASVVHPLSSVVVRGLWSLKAGLARLAAAEHVVHLSPASP